MKIRNPKLFNFLEFLSIFPEGIYLTKITIILLKENLHIEGIYNNIIWNNENLNYYF